MKATLTAGTWRRTWYALASLPLGAVWFSVVICGLAVGAALLITVLGVPVVLATLALARRGARAERRRARAVLAAGLPDRGAGPARGRIWSWPRLRQEAQDPPYLHPLVTASVFWATALRVQEFDKGRGPVGFSADRAGL